MTNRVRGKNRYGLWIVVAVLAGGLLCQMDRAEAAKNHRAYSAATSVEGQVMECFVVTGWFGWMTMQQIRTVGPVLMTPVIYSIPIFGFTYTMYIRHEHSFTPDPFSVGAIGNTRDSVFWAGTEWWEMSSIEY
jgi:hypothetical protein